MASSTPNLTEKETATLKAICENDFMDGLTGADAVGKEIWADCIFAPESIVPTTSLPGVVSSLSKKCLINCSHEGRDATITLTAAGAAAYWGEGA